MARSAAKATADFEVKAELRRTSHFFAKKRSAKKQTPPINADNANGATRMFCRAAAAKRNPARCIQARDNPQPGQGMPDIFLKIQNVGIEKTPTYKIPNITHKINGK